MFSIFGLIAVLFTLFAVGGIVALGYVQASKKTLKVGDLVRTTFQGSPAVLTTALFGLNAEYGSASSYGINYEQDAANALHCDMPSGAGIYSTWISDGGMNFKYNPSYTSTPLYILGGTCTDSSDCSKTSLKCGPGYVNAASSFDGTNTFPAGDSLWQPNAPNPAHQQCPNSSFCDLCDGPQNGRSNYCRLTDQTLVGNCKTTEGIAWQCKEVYPGFPNACAANIPVTVATPPHTRFESCSLNQNYSSLSFYYAFQGAINEAACDSPFGSISYFCNVRGNVNCLTGQECVANWGNGSETGWIVPSDVNNNYQKAAFVCSGTVFPMVVMQTDWIAEGKISSISGSKYYVDWHRVQNTYGGIGPSADSCNDSDGTQRCYRPTEATANDDSWVYSDCRFVKMENALPSRHLSVSNALLGTGQFAPRGLSQFSLTDTSYTENVLNLLHVSSITTGSIKNYFSNTNVPIPVHPQYKPTAWNLKNVYTKSDLSRIFFYSIHPMQVSEETTGWASTNFSVVQNNLNATYRH